MKVSGMFQELRGDGLYKPHYLRRGSLTGNTSITSEIFVQMLVSSPSHTCSISFCSLERSPGEQHSHSSLRSTTLGHSNEKTQVSEGSGFQSKF